MRLSVLLIIIAVCCGIRAADTGRVRKASGRGGRCYMYRLTLTDKAGTPYTLDCPQAYLSARSLERRRRQGIAVDSTDLPVSPVYVAAIERAGARVVSRSRWNNSVLVRGDDERLLQSLDTLSFVSSVRKVWTTPDTLKSPVRRERLSNVIHKWDTIAGDRYGHALEQIRMLGGCRLHDAGFTGEGVMITVMDGGFMNADCMQAFAATSFAGSADFVYPPSDDIFSEMSHGTMVLSVMAANLPGVYVGTAPDAVYLLLRCEDDKSESPAEEDYWAAAAEYADSMGTDIINSSLGFHAFDDASANYGYRDQDGMTAMISRMASLLAGKGIVMVCSAGNDGMETWKKINFPADARDILTVGAVSGDGVNASFSAVGPTADGRVKPDVMAMGSPAAVISGRGAPSRDVGTSFSAPMIAGLAACLWQALPSLTAREIIALVRRSGDNYATPDNIRGYGVPDFGRAYIMANGEW